MDRGSFTLSSAGRTLGDVSIKAHSMECPVCHGEGADHQQVGPAVTVFCCPACLNGVLRTFASHKDRDRRPGLTAVGAHPGSFH